MEQNLLTGLFDFSFRGSTVFYLPVVKEELCLDVTLPLEVALTVIRSLVDAFYIVQIFVRFRTAYVAPSSRVFGRGELVIDPSKITSRYLHKDFGLISLQPYPFHRC
ncbi:hypothetical protein SLA2020_432630 [Shorea laevis]